MNGEGFAYHIWHYYSGYPKDCRGISDSSCWCNLSWGTGNV